MRYKVVLKLFGPTRPSPSVCGRDEFRPVFGRRANLVAVMSYLTGGLTLRVAKTSGALDGSRRLGLGRERYKDRPISPL